MPLLWFCPACHWPLNEKPTRRDPRCPNCKSTLPVTSINCSISSHEDEKRPYALCSNSKCYFNIELHDRKNGHPIETPLECPRCKSSMISTCPQCGILLMGSPGATECAVCRADNSRRRRNSRADPRRVRNTGHPACASLRSFLSARLCFRSADKLTRNGTVARPQDLILLCASSNRSLS